MMAFLRYTMAFLAGLFGIGTIGVFTVFIYTGPFHLVSVPFSDVEKLTFDAALAMLFFMQHSLMVRPWFKKGLSRFIPVAYFGSIFSIVSGVVLLVLITLWQDTETLLLSCTGVCRLLLRSAFFFVLFLQAWALWSLKSADLFGIYALVGYPKTIANAKPELVLMAGAYRWVRHPIYSTSILLFWLYPDITADRLLLNAMFTLWVVIGTRYEERDLVMLYGDQYRDYQRAVPMLIPFRWGR